MSTRLPQGVRDWLPGAAARRRGVVAALSTEISRWGYRSVIPPLYEYDEVLRRGLGEGAPAMRFVEPSSGEILALRPDLTPQVARLVATRMHDEPGPLRLAYEGSVVRAQDHAAARELFQVGGELIDAPQPAGDLEVILLAEASLRSAGVGDLIIDLGHAAFTQAALDGLQLGEDDEAALHAALQKKDAAEVERLAARARISAKKKKLVAALPSLYGGAEVLSRAKKLVEGAAVRAVDELAALIERLSALGPMGRLSIDLGEVRGFRYYTGPRFAAYAPGAPGSLAAGGRYDRLVERYGRAARATGFAVDVDRVVELLLRRGAPAPSPAGDLYLAGEAAVAAKTAAGLRARGRTVVVDLDEPLPADAQLRERAARLHAIAVIVVAKGKARWFAVAGSERGTGLDALPRAR